MQQPITTAIATATGRAHVRALICEHGLSGAQRAALAALARGELVDDYQPTGLTEYAYALLRLDAAYAAPTHVAVAR